MPYAEKYKVHLKGLVCILPSDKLKFWFTNASTLKVIPLVFFFSFVPEIPVPSSKSARHHLTVAAAAVVGAVSMGRRLNALRCNFCKCQILICFSESSNLKDSCCSRGLGRHYALGYDGELKQNVVFGVEVCSYSA